MVHKAREYNRLYSVWEELTQKHGIAAAASHSRLLDIKHGVLLIEAEHPGWIQLLQTKEHKLLQDLQTTFPDIGINGIAFKLGISSMDNAADGDESKDKTIENIVAEDDAAAVYNIVADNDFSGYENIHSPELVETLKNLEKNILQKNKKPKR